MGKLRKLWAVIRLLRPPLLVLGFIAAYGLLKWSNSCDLVRSGLIVLSLGFGNVAFNILNEIVDKDVDAVNKPWKPLPSGEVSENTAWFLFYLFALASFGSLLTLTFFYDLFYGVGLTGYFTGFIYNGLQKQDLAGNICLGTTYGIAALMATYPKYPQLLFSLCFGLFAISYNVMAQWQDLEADRAMGVVTVPIQLGKLAFSFSLFLAFLNSILITWLYLQTMRAFLLVFLIVTVLIIFSTLGVKKKDKTFLEWVLRRGGRFLLTIGFIWMVLFA